MGILNFLLNQPKTYVPLIVMIIVNIMAAFGFPITDELKNSIDVICMAIAAWLIRRGMVKDANLESAVNKIIETRTVQLDNVVKSIVDTKSPK